MFVAFAGFGMLPILGFVGAGLFAPALEPWHLFLVACTVQPKGRHARTLLRRTQEVHTAASSVAEQLTQHGQHSSDDHQRTAPPPVTDCVCDHNTAALCLRWLDGPKGLGPCIGLKWRPCHCISGRSRLSPYWVSALSRHASTISSTCAQPSRHYSSVVRAPPWHSTSAERCACRRLVQDAAQCAGEHGHACRLAAICVSRFWQMAQFAADQALFALPGEPADGWPPTVLLPLDKQ